MQTTSEILNQLKKQIALNLPNNTEVEVDGVAFKVNRFNDIKDLIANEMSEHDKAIVSAQGEKPAFCLKEVNHVFINKPLFKVLDNEQRLLVLTHEYLHLKYPDLGEIHIIEYSEMMLRACGIEVKKV